MSVPTAKILVAAEPFLSTTAVVNNRSGLRAGRLEQSILPCTFGGGQPRWLAARQSALSWSPTACFLLPKTRSVDGVALDCFL